MWIWFIEKGVIVKTRREIILTKKVERRDNKIDIYKKELAVYRAKLRQKIREITKSKNNWKRKSTELSSQMKKATNQQKKIFLTSAESFHSQ
jgi:hypothetical protein